MKSDSLDVEQKEQLREIGFKLNHRRTAQNISLDEVAANTKIPKSLLLAIESADFEQLPEPFYVRFLIAKFAREIGATGIKFNSTESSSEIISDRPTNNSRRFRLPDFQLRSPHLYILYIILVFISVKGITLLVERPVVVNQLPEQPASTSVDTVNKSLEPKPKPKPQPPSQLVSQSREENSVTVGINLQERCWLQVMVDGKLAFEGILLEGTQRQWSGDKEVTIKAGNAGGVVITFNNQQQKVLGAPGQVEEITYTVN